MNEKELEEAQKVIDTPVTEENVEDPIEAVFPEKEADEPDLA